MRIALMSDIHGNREAFAACLEHAAQNGVDRYVFLGDFAGYGADPGWVIDTVMARVADGAVAVLGNHDAAALANAGLFYQTISAYPTSALAKNFQQAMSDTNDAATNAADGSANSSQNVSDAITKNANAFFQSTKSFQNVTLAGLVAMENYYQSFPFVWAEFGNTTYYLYSSDGKTTSFVGTISLQKPTTLDLTQQNGGYSCVFKPAVNPSDTTTVNVDGSKATSLTYGNGLFVDNANADVPQIAVKGTFQIKRLFTQKTTDTQIIPVLTGSVYGSTCIGFDAPQKSNDSQDSAFWNSLFHPKNSAEIFKSVMTIGGAVMMLFFFGQIALGIYRWARGLGAAKEPTTADLLKKQSDALEKAFQDKLDEAVKKISDGRQKAPENPDKANNEISESRDAVVDNGNAARLNEGLKSEASSLKELAEYESSMNGDQVVKLESAAESVRESSKALNEASPDTLHEVVGTQRQALDGIQSNVSDLTTSLDQTLSTEAKNTIAENAATTNQVQEDINEANKDQEDEVNDDDPDGGEGIEPIDA